MVGTMFSKYARKPRRSIPTSIPNLLANSYMVEQLVKDIYGIAMDDVKCIGIRENTTGSVQGNLSDSGRLRLRIQFYTGEERELYWFVKIMPQPPTGITHGDFNIFTNEIEFYQKIVPEMKNFLRSEGFDGAIELDVPEILYAKQDDTGAILVLDDISADGYAHERDANGDKYLSVEQAVVAVRSIARIHAISVAVQEKQNVDLCEEHPSLRESGMLWTQAEMASRLEAMKESYCSCLEQSKEVDSPTLLERFRNTFDSADRLYYLCQKRCETDSKKCRSLQHGDFHFNNLMFKTLKDGTMRVKIVDWQLTYSGRSTGDLSYLLMSSLSQKNREDYEEEIKNEYFSAYMDTLQMLSSMGVEDDVFDNDYTDSLPLSFFLSCGNIMALQERKQSVKFSYELCKEAVLKEII